MTPYVSRTTLTSTTEAPTEAPTDDMDFDSLEAFINELNDFHTYAMYMLKILKQKYMKKPSNLNDKIKQLQVMIDEVFTEENHDEY